MANQHNPEKYKTWAGDYAKHTFAAVAGFAVAVLLSGVVRHIFFETPPWHIVTALAAGVLLFSFTTPYIVKGMAQRRYAVGACQQCGGQLVASSGETLLECDHCGESHPDGRIKNL